MKLFHLSLSTVFALHLLASPGFAQNSLRDGSSRFAMTSFFRAAQDPGTVFRAQSPESGGVPMPTAPGQATAVPSGESSAIQSFSGSGNPGGETFGMPMNGDFYSGMGNSSCCGSQDVTTWNAFSPPMTSDPFLQPNAGFQPNAGYQAGPYAPYSPYGAAPQGAAPQAITTYGANGARPYRYGWNNAVDVSWLPSAGVTAPAGGATGTMGILGADYRLGYTSPFIPGWILNWTNQFGYRNWDGPSGSIGLPSDLFRFGVDLEMETPQAGPYSLSLGITPSYNTDFDGSSGDAFQLDGRGIMLIQLDQYWSLGLGAMYWDRVKGRVIPYAGLIYRDDYWEWQLMFPEARVSLFLGNETYWSKWLYVRGEYHVEAYGIEETVGGVRRDDEVEVEDYRILLGMNMESSLYSWFFEGGWVLDRSVNFKNATTPDFDLNTGFIGQIGLRY